MKSDVNLTEFLNTYEIAQPEESQITDCIKRAKQVVQIKRVQRDERLLFFIETQLKFMKGEMIFSFLASIGLMIMIKFFQSFVKVKFFSEISVGIAPFMVVPIIYSIAKSKKVGMLELESVSKIGLQRIIALRIIVNQALAILMISLIWWASCATLENFTMNRLYFSLISFEIAAICFLWFGKSSIKAGVFSVAAWTGMMLIFLSWEKAFFWMQTVNSMALLLITMALIGISTIVIYEYVKNVSFESEETKWNLGWTD